MQKNILLYFFTIKHIKPIQLYWRIYLKIKKFLPFPLSIKGPVECKQLQLLPCIEKYESLSADKFTFLNVTRPFLIPVDWNNSKESLLWLYNLHYFDYLNQHRLDKNVAIELINDWISHNKVGEGVGWQPYPISLRVVNWIKYLTGVIPSDRDNVHINQSLYIQVRYLYNNLEYHLLGNHLFKNGVALLFAGSFFKGKEATKWLNKGLQIINEQLDEQILPDGGHFERSPMYHVLILEDILDCLNIAQSTDYIGQHDVSNLEKIAAQMLGFLFEIIHQEGEIPFFNDTALKISPSPKNVLEYAVHLGVIDDDWLSGLNNPATKCVSFIEKPEFGLYVIENKTSRLIVDAGKIGPDYLPGHAHCDTLSYELSIAGKRSIVNSGVYQYAGEFRNKFRATRAHNTIRIDAQEQHEIWSTFRVARRGYPFEVKIDKSAQNVITFSAAHNGYMRLPGHPIHRREIVCNETGWGITDSVEGEGIHSAESYIHLHPEVKIVTHSKKQIKCCIGTMDFTIFSKGDSDFEMEEGEYSPEFGIKENNKVIVLRKQGICPYALSYHIQINMPS